MVSSDTTHFGYTDVPVEEKEQRVRGVFDSVAENYDLMNDLMSFGVHRLWKRFAVRRLRLREGDSALDVAGGTGDLARLMTDRMNKKGRVTVMDINDNMLIAGRAACADKGYLGEIGWSQGNAESLPFPDNTFQAVTVGFGIRNVTRIETAFKEMVRVLRPGGQLLCLEFSHVAVPFLRPGYDFYSFKLLPEIGHYVAKDRDAYQYLVESIRKFPDQEALKEMLEGCGLYKVTYHNLTSGVAAVHLGYKV